MGPVATALNSTDRNPPIVAERSMEQHLKVLRKGLKGALGIGCDIILKEGWIRDGVDREIPHLDCNMN